MPIYILRNKGTRVMAEYWNDVQNNPNIYSSRSYTPEENAKAEMERQDIERAEKAVNQQRKFGSIIFSQKLKEYLVPERVMQECAEVGYKLLINFSPIHAVADWYDEHQAVIEGKDEEEKRGYYKQMHQTNFALAKEAAKDPAGQKFVYDM